MPINFKWVKVIDSFFPEAKIIWCERYLTDAAWSIYRSFFSTQGNNFAWDAGDIVNYLSLYKNCLKFCEDSRIPVFRFTLNKSLADKKMQMKQLENFLGLALISLNISLQQNISQTQHLAIKYLTKNIEAALITNCIVANSPSKSFR